MTDIDSPKPPALRLGTVILALMIFVISSASSFALVHVENVVTGISGYVRPDRWIPVVFQFYNPGPDFRGTVEVQKGETIFRKSLDLGSGTRKRVEILYFHSNYYETLSYSIRDQNGVAVLQNRIDTQILNYQDNLLLVLSEREFNHQFLNGQQNPWGGKTFVGYMKPQEMFSDWIAYSGADVVAVGSISANEILPAQLLALFQYLAAGGILITTPATDLSFLQHPYLRDNLPDYSAGLETISSQKFLRRAWTQSTTSEFPEFTLPIRTFQMRASDQELVDEPPNIHLLIASPYYKGTILSFAYDYTQFPDSVRTMFARMWNEYIFPSSPTTQPVFSLPFRKRLEENPRVQKFLYDIPGLRLPDVKWFALFFFLYLCCIGPLQFFVLRNTDRQSLLWITFPGVILLFTVGSFAYSRFRHSGERRITHVAVTELFPSVSGQNTFQVYGTTLEESGIFRFQAIPDNSYLRKFALQTLTYQPEPYTLSEDLPHQLEGERIKSWTFRTFDAFSSEPLRLPLSVRARGNEDQIVGEIHNGTDFDIQDSFFFFDTKNVAVLGTIEKGSRRSFSLALKNTTAAPFADQHLRDLLRLDLSPYATPHFFFGQIRDAKGELIINGKNRKTHCTKYIAIYLNLRDTGRRHLLSQAPY